MTDPEALAHPPERAVTLDPESVRAVAHAVVELLADTQPPAGRLVDAAELAATSAAQSPIQTPVEGGPGTAEPPR